MLFRVERVSISSYSHNGHEKPCPTAYNEEGKWYVQIMTMDEFYVMLRLLDRDVTIQRDEEEDSRSDGYQLLIHEQEAL